jgi:polysaccharide pyruvyl transferase WcaK-like protein
MSHDSNRGDFAILAATIDVLRQHVSGITVTAVSVELPNRGLEDLEETELTRGLGCSIVGTPTPSRRYFPNSTGRWISRLLWAEVVALLAQMFGRRAFALLPRDTRAFIATFAGADLAIAKGGSYLYAMGGIRELVYLWRMLYPIRVAKMLSPRVVLLGVSIGEFRSPGSSKLARAVLGRGVELYVREQWSLDRAREELHLPVSSVRMVPDLAFLTRSRATGAPASAPPESDGATIGVTVRHHGFAAGGAAAARARYVGGTAEALRQLIDRGDAAKVVFVPQVDEDASLAREIAGLVDRPEQVDLVEVRLDLDALLAIYESLDVLLGARLHSVILAAVVGVPSVHVVYEPSKSQGTLALLGMEEFGILYEDVTAEQLVRLIRRILDGRPELSTALTERVGELRSDVNRAVEDVLCREAVPVG